MLAAAAGRSPPAHMPPLPSLAHSALLAPIRTQWHSMGHWMGHSARTPCIHAACALIRWCVHDHGADTHAHAVCWTFRLKLISCVPLLLLQAVATGTTMT